MNYLIFGKQTLMVKKRLNNLLHASNEVIDEFTVSYFDYNKEKNDLSELILAITSVPFLYDKKSVVILNPTFLTKKLEGRAKDILEAIQQEDDTVDVYFVYENDDISPANEIYKYIKENGKISELKDLKPDEWPQYITNYFIKKGYQIDEDATEELSKRVEGDLFCFVNEANKLMNYTDHIKLVDVLALVHKPLEDDVFQLVNALIRRDNGLALLIYRDLKTQGREIMDSLIPLLGNQYRFYSQIYYLYDLGLDETMIAKEMSANAYRVKMALRNRKFLRKSMVKSILSNLYMLDCQTKSGLIDRNFAIEMFIINYPDSLNLANL